VIGSPSCDRGQGAMADMEGAKNPLLRVEEFLRDWFIPHEREIRVYVDFRAFTKWYFDFMKNLITVGALSILDHKTHSVTIFVFAWASQTMLAIYILTYLLRLNIFHIFGNSKLVPIISGAIGVVGMLGIQYVIFNAVYAMVFQ
jgi:hypothetical protein